VWAIPESERGARAKWTTDLWRMGERYFIRGLLRTRFTDRPGYFGWGLWVEVEASVFNRYLALYDRDASSEPPHQGQLANQPPGYQSLLNVPLSIQFSSSTERPELRFPLEARSELAREQRSGIDSRRYHEILVAVGAIEP